MSRRAYREALACSESLGPSPVAVILEDQGAAELLSRHRQEAVDAYTAALKVRREAGASALAQARSVYNLAQLAALQGKPAKAVEIHRDVIRALEAEAPHSMTLAGFLAVLASALTTRGDLEAAEEAFARARTISEMIGPAEGPALAGVLSGQGGLALDKGDLASAEHLWRRAWQMAHRLAPASVGTAIAQLNLGALAATRGDLDGAEAWFQSALLLVREAEAGRGPRALLLHNLGDVARGRGDIAAAEDLLRRSVAEFEALAPGGLRVAQTLRTLGETLGSRGDRSAARDVLRRALELSERLAPDGTPTAEALATLGDVARADGDWRLAEDCYGRARLIYDRLAPASANLAHVLHGLGAVQRGRGHIEEAESLFAAAIESLEAQRSRVGVSDEARSLLNSRFFGLYQDQIDLLAGQGRDRDAFDVLERSRARSLLTLVAERDLVIEGEVPSQLERERRRVDADYERTRTALEQLGVEKNSSEIDRLRSRLHELRERQNEISAKIREASPRLADLRDPQPLDADGVQANLEPGTAFLAYSVGAEKTILFVLTAAGASVRTITIPLGEAELRERVAQWRHLAERTVPAAEFFTQARALYDLLLRPAEPHLRSARRLLVSPDGPLHKLPFAALRRGESYLAEWKPVSLVPSGTIYAKMVRSRESGTYALDFEAFGDPRAADLDPLPATRHEVTSIARLFPETAVHLGDEATEEHAKAVGKGVRYVHFASHGLIDERLPLDSALALSAPPSPDEGRENGRLHAWEIIERVRLDADLVTLSACRSAVGTELAGEGLIGLTRAFHYAGARSVLASLWSVGDKSTYELMRAVYRFLRDGLPKDEALRRAQLDAVRRGHHPVRWAAFQLYGDWRSSLTRGVSARAKREAGTRPVAGPAVALREASLPRS